MKILVSDYLQFFKNRHDISQWVIWHLASSLPYGDIKVVNIDKSIWRFRGSLFAYSKNIFGMISSSWDWHGVDYFIVEDESFKEKLDQEYLLLTLKEKSNDSSSYLRKKFCFDV